MGCCGSVDYSGEDVKTGGGAGKEPLLLSLREDVSKRISSSKSEKDGNDPGYIVAAHKSGKTTFPNASRLPTKASVPRSLELAKKTKKGGRKRGGTRKGGKGGKTSGGGKSSAKPDASKSKKPPDAGASSAGPPSAGAGPMSGGEVGGAGGPPPPGAGPSRPGSAAGGAPVTGGGSGISSLNVTETPRPAGATPMGPDGGGGSAGGAPPPGGLPQNVRSCGPGCTHIHEPGPQSLARSSVPPGGQFLPPTGSPPGPGPGGAPMGGGGGRGAVATAHAVGGGGGGGGPPAGALDQPYGAIAFVPPACACGEKWVRVRLGAGGGGGGRATATATATTGGVSDPGTAGHSVFVAEEYCAPHPCVCPACKGVQPLHFYVVRSSSDGPFSTIRARATVPRQSTRKSRPSRSSPKKSSHSSSHSNSSKSDKD